MKIFCYDCKTVEETNFLIRCTKCESESIGIEESYDFHQLCGFFAIKKGWGGPGGELSLPWWIQRHPEILPEWQEFKRRLVDVEAIELPANFHNPSYGKPWEQEKIFHQRCYDHFIDRSGILLLQQGTVADLLGAPVIGPLVHRMASNYADHHQARRRLSEGGNDP